MSEAILMPSIKPMHGINGAMLLRKYASSPITDLIMASVSRMTITEVLELSYLTTSEESCMPQSKKSVLQNLNPYFLRLSNTPLIYA